MSGHGCTIIQGVFCAWFDLTSSHGSSNKSKRILDTNRDYYKAFITVFNRLKLKIKQLEQLFVIVRGFFYVVRAWKGRRVGRD